MATELPELPKKYKLQEGDICWFCKQPADATAWRGLGQLRRTHTPIAECVLPCTHMRGLHARLAWRAGAPPCKPPPTPAPPRPPSQTPGAATSCTMSHAPSSATGPASSRQRAWPTNPSSGSTRTARARATSGCGASCAGRGGRAVRVRVCVGVSNRMRCPTCSAPKCSAAVSHVDALLPTSRPRGATFGCLHGPCTAVYHFPCARLAAYQKQIFFSLQSRDMACKKHVNL
jgi:hypothetical protein